MSELIPAAGNILSAPGIIFGQGRKYFKTYMKESVAVIFPHETDMQRTRELQKTQPLHEVDLGISAINRGEKKGQSELITMGGLMIARAVVKAERSKFVPDRVTEEVLDIAMYDAQIYPEINPLLTKKDFNTTLEVIEKFNNVFPMFPEPQNKL